FSAQAPLPAPSPAAPLTESTPIHPCHAPPLSVLRSSVRTFRDLSRHPGCRPRPCNPHSGRRTLPRHVLQPPPSPRPLASSKPAGSAPPRRPVGRSFCRDLSSHLPSHWPEPTGEDLLQAELLLEGVLRLLEVDLLLLERRELRQVGRL